MGGRHHFGHGRVARPVALVCALGTLVAALMLCVRPAGGHPAGTVPAASAVRASAARTATGPDAAAPPAHRAPVAHRAPAAGHAAYSCPDGMPGCSRLGHRTPGILTVPPPGSPGPELPVLVPRSRPEGRALPVQPPARAPDLHVLQVLRT
ncbi:hypothetical protein [Streptomyces sp. NPDC097619]|uniref:hypothetical protein n=1 Tax=Streptomyces sp. NPDC097619 TaxID=3157228 RepID=UPI00331F16DF